MRVRILLNILIIGVVYLVSAQSAYTLNHAKSKAPFKIYKNPREEILKHWNDRVESISLGRNKTGTSELDNIKDTMRAFGLKNVPEISISLLREIEKRKGELSPKERLELAKTALYLTPGLPTVHFKIIPYYLQLKTFKPFKALNEFIAGIKISVKNIDTRLILAANLIYWLALSVIIVLIIFMLIMSIKYSKPLHHMISHFLPKWLSGLSITLILVFLPLFVFLILGPLSVFLIAVLYYWLFLKPGEKIIAVFSLIIIILLPVLFYLPTFSIKFYSSNEAEILRANLQSDYETNSKVLASLIEKNPNDLEAKFVLALIAKRAGNRSYSTKLLSEIIKENPSWDKPYVNLGNIYYIRGRIESAIANYVKAASVNGSNFLAKYNLGKAYYKQTNLDDANSQLKSATSLDPIEFQRLETLSNPKNPSRYVFDESISFDDLKQRIKKYNKLDPDMRNNLWERSDLINATPLTSSLITAILIMLLIVLSKSKRTLAPPKLCTICGMAYCKRCSKIMDRRNVCSQCYYVFISRDTIDPNYRTKKEREEKQHKKKIKVYRNIVSLILPGLGHIYLGSALAGCFTIFILSFSAVMLIFSKGIVSDPYGTSLSSSVTTDVFLIALMVVTYVLNNISIRRSR